MSALIAPRYDLPIVDAQSGRLTREWYKYLANLGSALNFSPSSIDDLTTLSEVAEASTQGRTFAAQSVAADALARAMLDVRSVRQLPDDPSLLAWWPQ